MDRCGTPDTIFLSERPRIGLPSSKIAKIQNFQIFGFYEKVESACFGNLVQRKNDLSTDFESSHRDLSEYGVKLAKKARKCIKTGD